MPFQESISLVASGERALFTRPETRADRVSYPVLTPSAARGIVDSIFFKPEMMWDILMISVLYPWWTSSKSYPQTMSIKRNEVKTKMSEREIRKQFKAGCLPCIEVDSTKHRTQRSSLLLKDVAYQITIRPRVLDYNEGRNNQGKYFDIINRRLENGQFYNKPYFGCREFDCDVRLPKPTDQVRTGLNLDCGLMVHHLDYSVFPPKPVWFHAVIKEGVLNCNEHEVEMVK